VTALLRASSEILSKKKIPINIRLTSVILRRYMQRPRKSIPVKTALTMVQNILLKVWLLYDAYMLKRAKQIYQMIMIKNASVV